MLLFFFPFFFFGGQDLCTEVIFAGRKRDAIQTEQIRGDREISETGSNADNLTGKTFLGGDECSVAFQGI